MFINGESAMYYIGTWEFAAMNDLYNEGKIDYFFMPKSIDDEGDGKPYCVNSGTEWRLTVKHLMRRVQTLLSM